MASFFSCLITLTLFGQNDKINSSSKDRLDMKFSISLLEKFLSQPFDSVNDQLTDKGYSKWLIKRFYAENLFDSATLVFYHARLLPLDSNKAYYITVNFAKGKCYSINWTTPYKSDYSSLVKELKLSNYHFDEKITQLYINEGQNELIYGDLKSLNSLHLSNEKLKTFYITISNTFVLWVR